MSFGWDEISIRDSAASHHPSLLTSYMSTSLGDLKTRGFYFKIFVVESGRQEMLDTSFLLVDTHQFYQLRAVQLA